MSEIWELEQSTWTIGTKNEAVFEESERIKGGFGDIAPDPASRIPVPVCR